MSIKTPSPLHQTLVQALVNAFIGQKQYQIEAATIKEYPDPGKVGRHEPDILARDANGNWHIGEAKTGDGDLNDQAKEQFMDFSQFHLHIIVPKDKEVELEKFLTALGLIGKVATWIL